ncbi:TPA: hypothetical protein N0F65_009403 [Lagenidium giganteum]|uniref:Uncharacterized protein n=1 Tax=Lagenidium giganteum TaxID=4803 RepID=A0AAV2ZCP4_9STRA|nr:TPA: hypothetical protein N0F65_009403 [Lagenidium giganteum]
MLETRRRQLNSALLLNLVLSAALFITTLFLLETPYVGFNAFCTAGVHIAYAFAAIVTLNKTPSAFSIGVLVGASPLVLVLSFEGALYWGLIAADNGVREAASIAACLLHVMIFCIQLGVTWVIIKSKEDVIDTYAAYEFIPDSGYGDRLSLSSPAAPGNYHTAAPTADI